VTRLAASVSQLVEALAAAEASISAAEDEARGERERSQALSEALRLAQAAAAEAEADGGRPVREEGGRDRELDNYREMAGALSAASRDAAREAQEAREEAQQHRKSAEALQARLAEVECERATAQQNLQRLQARQEPPVTPQPAAGLLQARRLGLGNRERQLAEQNRVLTEQLHEAHATIQQLQADARPNSRGRAASPATPLTPSTSSEGLVDIANGGGEAAAMEQVRMLAKALRRCRKELAAERLTSGHTSSSTSSSR
jgi:dTMP kinase